MAVPNDMGLSDRINNQRTLDEMSLMLEEEGNLSKAYEMILKMKEEIWQEAYKIFIDHLSDKRG